MTASLIRLAIALVVCTAALIGYRVWYGVVANNSVAVVSAQRTIDERIAARTREASSQPALAQLADDEALIQSYFVTEEEAPTFISDLEQRGRQTGTTVTVTSVAKSGADLTATLALALVVRGGFDAVMRTVGVIENAPYDLSIASLVLAREADKSWRADVHLSVGAVPQQPTTP